MNTHQRLKQRQDALQTEYQLRSDKLKQLRLDYVIEAGTAIKFQLDQQIKSEETKLSLLEKELDEIDQNLSLGAAFSFSPSEDIKPTRFIYELGTRLKNDKKIHELSKDEEFAEFDFIGYKESSLTLDFVAFKKADGLNERQIVQLCDKFFEITQTVSYDFRLKPLARMPNSLLGLIFEDECPSDLIDFIKKQTKISHWGKSAVLVTWVIHLKQKQIYTHNNPVSLLPPVVILEGSVFPGLDYLKSFLSAYRS
jgi:hypothetical protein